MVRRDLRGGAHSCGSGGSCGSGRGGGSMQSINQWCICSRHFDHAVGAHSCLAASPLLSSLALPLLPRPPLSHLPPGGNNDTSFYTPDLLICVTDPHRVGHEQRFYPGDVCFRWAPRCTLANNSLADAG